MVHAFKINALDAAMFEALVPTCERLADGRAGRGVSGRGTLKRIVRRQPTAFDARTNVGGHVLPKSMDIQRLVVPQLKFSIAKLTFC
jgi:hypothetical protein